MTNKFRIWKKDAESMLANEFEFIIFAQVDWVDCEPVNFAQVRQLHISNKKRKMLKKILLRDPTTNLLVELVKAKSAFYLQQRGNN